jgi:hypothetical protein
MFSEALTILHPEFEQDFKKLAQRISKSRIIGGVHFPSDCKAGIILGRDVVRHGLVDFLT